MAKKKNNGKIKISFCGNNSTNVTGSMILIETENKNILLECGITQSQNMLEDYKNNSSKFPFKAKNIDYLFINHVHADHSCLTPKLIHDGFEGKIIATHLTARLMKPMLNDSCKIVTKDCEYLLKKRGKDLEPFYIQEDVDKALNLTYEYDYSEIYELDEYISFRFLKNSHIIGAAQLELFIKSNSGHVNKILYTSDLGGNKIKNYYTEENELCSKASVVISECTYGSTDKNKSSDRNKDLEKIKTVVNQVCLEAKGRILIPVFSLARSQQILTDLYMLFSEDKDFKIPIVVDSPLIWEITQVYKNELQGEQKELFEKVFNWSNVRFIKDYNESEVCSIDKSPKLVLSSSGFLQKGRSVQYLKQFIKNKSDHVITVGYAPEGSIAYKIKHNQKYITIDGESFKNKCGITVLNSYSSHISQIELLNYLKSINADKYYLVHGDKFSKEEFKKLLEEELQKMCKTSRVISTNKDTVCNL